MKHLRFLPLLLLVGCAHTKLYDPVTGHLVADFQGQYATSEYRAGKTYWKATGVDHASATVAQGNAATKVMGGVGGMFGAAAAAAAMLH